MDENTRVIIGLRLERCHEDLKFARLLLQPGRISSIHQSGVLRRVRSYDGCIDCPWH